jgi:y4mF family transcriptional regulator
VLVVKTMADLGTTVRDRRRRLGYSQEELARRAGVSRKWISDVERGKSTVQMQPVLDVLEALDIVLEPSEEHVGPVTAQEQTDRIRARGGATSFGDRLGALGITTVALDEEGRIMEYRPDGTAVPVG